MSEDIYPVTKRYVHIGGVSWYQIMYDPLHREFRWVWHDKQSDFPVTLGPNYDTIGLALLGAAYDWTETTGNLGNMATRLKLAAAHYGGSTSTNRHYG